jgi:hypothetical protein
MNRFGQILTCLLLSVAALRADTLSFRNDVLPVLSRAGCMNGACHAKAGGQNGFQLSIFSYDPKADYRQIVHEARGRRVFPSAPEESLLLLKATQAIDHEGGQRFDNDSEFYRILHTWIGQGAPWASSNELTLERITVEPVAGQYRKGSHQQLTVTAHYSDESKRDITHLSEYQSNDQAVATVEHDGEVKIGGVSGEAVIVVRYVDKVEVSRLAVPTDRKLPAEVYAKLPVGNDVDRLVYERHRQLGLLVSARCSDAEFIRRASLDTVGKLPAAERVREFLASKESKKREKYIDELLADPDWADFWAIKWGDLLRPNTRHVGVKPVMLMDRWIRRSFRSGMPYDEFVRELLTATGSSHEVGPVALLRDKRDPKFLGAYVSQVFMGVRLDCAQCHHHPNEKWGQEDYYQMAAFFGSMKRKGQGISAPISGEPEYWWWQTGGTVKHPVTGEVMPPKPPDGPLAKIPAGKDPRAALVDWLLEPDNPFFARAVVNRIWGEMFGRGIVDPVDDFRASNPPTNGPLLDWLAKDFVQYGYDFKRTIRHILRSRIYQASSIPNKTNLGDDRNFARSARRRISAEVMSDALTTVTGVPMKFEGLAKDVPAMQNWNRTMRSTLLDTFGRPDASAECPCERDPSATIVQSLHLMNSNALEGRIGSSAGQAAKLAKSKLKPEGIVEEMYLAVYSRLPSADEKKLASAIFKNEKGEPTDRQKATEDLMWALLNTPEFVLNR